MAVSKYPPLPIYTPSEPSPKYSNVPTPQERTLQHTPRLVRPAPTGTFTKKCNGVTVILFEQEHDAKIPKYGRHADINGTIYFEDPRKVLQVTVKVEGRLDATSSEAGTKSTSLLSFNSVLWQRGDMERASKLIPFSYVLPSTFCFNGKDQALPPSCSVEPSGLSIRVRYSITICVTRARHRSIEFLTKEDDICIPFKYHPRTRAHRPIVPAPSFFSVVKTSPEEWYQALSTMQAKSPSTTEPIHCHLFAPASRIYGLTDRIPFHVQLNGPLDSLRKLLVPQHEPTSSLPWSHKKHDQKLHLLPSMPKIRVYLMRQCFIDTNGAKAWRNITVGEGDIWEVPPAIFESQGAVHLDWEGELRCQEDVSFGGFIAGHVGIKDYMVLSLEPPTFDNQPSPFSALQMTVPIRFVTDSYTEVTDYEPPDP